MKKRPPAAASGLGLDGSWLIIDILSNVVRDLY